MSRVIDEKQRKEARERIKDYVIASRNRRNKKTANLRLIAAEQPHEVGNCLGELSAKFADLATVFTGLSKDAAALRSNLDLDEPSKTASVRDRIEARKRFARTLRHLANDHPQELGAALSEVYKELDDAVDGIETLAENFGVDLDYETPEEEAEAINTENELDEAADQADAAKAAEVPAAEPPAPIA